MDLVKNFVKDWIIPIVSAIIIALLVRQFVFFLILVPSGSMYPTIKQGDRIFVTRIHSFNKIERGDILVFYSEELDKRLIKRVIGLPNEEVLIKSDGSVYIDGEKLPEPYVKNPSGKTASFKVPENEYLFIGDNRANSHDARYWNEPYISREKIEGKAHFVIFPFDRIGFLK